MRSSLAACPDPAAEIASQRAFLLGFETSRILGTLLASGLMALFLPLWLAVLFLGFDYLFEALCQHLMTGLDPNTAPGRYRAALLATYLMEASYVLPSALIWQQDDPYARAAAVGLICMTLFQLATVRAIHLPFGLAGLAGVFLTGTLSNTQHWLRRGDAAGLAISSLAIAGVTYYTLSAMRANNRLHRENTERIREAAAANATKGRFLAQMSHELRTPLNAILGMGEAELVESHEPRTRDRMRTLTASARGLAVILDDVLDMSALAESALPIRPQPADPQAVITATMALFQPLFAAKGLALTLDLPAALPAEAALDPHRLRQCLSNLLSNALKFTETGGARVSARMANPGLLEIEVADTGPGIAPAAAEAVFAPFNRADAAQPGSGLGLAISRGLARQMGGDLRLLPSERGARLGLSLKIKPLAAARPLPDPAPPVPALTGLRVLVVDDIATNRLVAATYLHLLGALPTEAADGQSALIALRNQPTDAVLLDMNMPGLSGEETLAAIRALPGARGRIRVLAMTADVAARHQDHYRAIGIDGIVGKPLTAAQLARALVPAAPPDPAQG